MTFEHFPEIFTSNVKSVLKNLGRRPAVKKVAGLFGASSVGPGIGMADMPVPGRVVMYFGDTASKIYQVTQWLPVLEQLNEKLEVLLVFRSLSAFRAASKLTSLPKIYIRKYADLIKLYNDNDLRLVIYVNNSYSNFQSIEHPRLVHVHVNHGESDKLSMVSNRAKAYDRVLVAGPAAIKRHESMLVDFDFSKLLVTGRPQLDIDFAPELEASDKFDVMYAPTWEGENDDNNYTSIDLYGEQIINLLLGSPAIRIVYKPHPRVQSSTNPSVAEAHKNILNLIDESNALGANHLVCLQGNILAMFASTDALITDVSSVALDYLYLHPERPIVLSDRRTNPANLLRDAPVSQACQVIDSNSIALDSEFLHAALFEDEHVNDRQKMRSFYFGDLAIGESTLRFEQIVEQLIEERAKKLIGFRQWHS